MVNCARTVAWHRAGRRQGIVGKIGLVAGPLVFILVILSPIGKIVLGLALWMASWWVTAAIPIYATALLPIIVLPATGVLELADVVLPYADRIIFLFMGGLLLAKAVEKSGAHRRFALGIVSLFGTRPKYVVAGFMVVTGVLSAWMSNTATVALIIPMAASLSGTLGIDPLLLMVPVTVATTYGFMMPVGTPPNAIAFASGYVTAPRMARVGVPLAIMGILVVSLITDTLVPLVWT